MYAITPQGLLSMFGFMGSHAGSVKQFKMSVPEKSLRAELFPEQNELQVDLRPYMMSRIIDFEKV